MPDARTSSLPALAELLRNHSTVILSGAGISTESGIPDYRSPQGLRRGRKPMTYQEFTASETARRRYWARGFAGWQGMQGITPNSAHRSVARLEEAGFVTGVITQNVDSLHQAAGSRNVIELHGRLALVRCLSCGSTEPRSELQERLAALNSGTGKPAARLAPDGDADLSAAAEAAFEVAACRVCGGLLKPDVVFFGENVPRPRLERAWELFAAADVLLVLGSSLAVASGFRFVERAVRDGKPVGIINRGPTEGDALATVRLAGALGELLPALERELLGT
jgi:NAD-dependent SIR2 family protein deacetylase